MAVPCLVSLELHISIRQCRAMACEATTKNRQLHAAAVTTWLCPKCQVNPSKCHGLSMFIHVYPHILRKNYILGGGLPPLWDPKQQLIADSKSWIAKALETAQRTTSRSARKDWWQCGSANPSLATAVIATSLSAWSLSSWAFDYPLVN